MLSPQIKIGKSAYFVLFCVLMHLTQAFTLWPPIFIHCKLGYFLFLQVGLYLPLNLTRFVTMTEPFPQIEHCLGIAVRKLLFRF